MLKWKVTVSGLGEIYAYFEASEVKHIFDGQARQSFSRFAQRKKNKDQQRSD